MAVARCLALVFALLLLLLPAASVAAAAAADATPARRALVIGNAAYAKGPLRNPVNDARAVATALQRLGWQASIVENGSYPEMDRAIRRFGDALAEGSVGLFYYAGHGVQVGGRNFLIPVDADIEREDEVPFKAIDAGQVLAKLESAGNAMNIVILDACRNNPFARASRSTAAGLAAMDAPVGTIIAYATAPGAEARDGRGSNGLYTRHLLTNLMVPGLKVEDVFKRVRAAVRQETGGEQVPWENTSLEGDFYFIPPGDTGLIAAAPPTVAKPTADIAATRWPGDTAAPSGAGALDGAARCWGILHRASIGEPLSAEDEHFLRSACKRAP